MDSLVVHAALAAVELVGLILLARICRDRPEPTFAAIVFVLMTRASDLPALDSLPISLNQVVSGAALVAVLWRWRRGQQRGIAIDRFLVGLLIYGGAMLLSIPGAVSPYDAAAATIAYSRDLLVVFAALSLVTSLAGLRLAVWACVAAGGTLALAALVHHLTGYSPLGLSNTELAFLYGDVQAPLYFGTMFDSNHFAQGLVMLLPPALYLAWLERAGWLKAAGALAAFGMSEVILLTFSRGGLLALLFVLGGAATLQRRVRLRPLTVIGLIGLLIIVAPWQYQGRLALTGEFVAERASRLFRPGLSANPAAPASASSGLSAERQAAFAEEARFGSLDERSRAWRVGAQMVREHPLFGVGQRNYYLAYRSVAPWVDPGMSASPRGAHNSPVHVAAETGLVGLAAWSYAIFVGLLGALEARRLLAKRGDADGAALLEALLLGALGFLVSALFLNANFFRYLWLLLALAAAGRRIARLGRTSTALGGPLTAG
jgi:O-antigen ligase